MKEKKKSTPKNDSERKEQRTKAENAVVMKKKKKKKTCMLKLSNFHILKMLFETVSTLKSASNLQKNPLSVTIILTAEITRIPSCKQLCCKINT